MLESAGGVITHRDPSRCTVRLRCPAGLLTPEQLEGLGRIARDAGIESVHLTTRQTLELPGINPVSISPLLKALEENGTPLGAERNEVVNVVACPGTACCRLGAIETYQEPGTRPAGPSPGQPGAPPIPPRPCEGLVRELRPVREELPDTDPERTNYEPAPDRALEDLRNKPGQDTKLPILAPVEEKTRVHRLVHPVDAHFYENVFIPLAE